MSKRPDGSIRKEVKVRPGYIAPEDVTSYKTARQQAMQGPPIIPGYGEQPIGNIESTSRNQRRNEKRKAAKTIDTDAGAAEPTIPSGPSSTLVAEGRPISSQPSKTTQRTLKILNKKLRQILELELKIRNAELEPNADQLEKLKLKASIELEINSLMQ